MISDLKCLRCNSNKLRKAGFHAYSDGRRVQRYKCKSCRRSFAEQYCQLPIDATGISCPQCGSDKVGGGGLKIYPDGRRVRRYICKSCSRSFAEQYCRPPIDVTGISCPQCGSDEVGGGGLKIYPDGGQVQQYRCKNCSKCFLNKYRQTPAQLAFKECPKCGSSDTVKHGKPKEVMHGIVQSCRCKDCGKYFSLGGRKLLRVFLQGKEIYTCRNPPGLQHVPNVACPACGQEKAVLKMELKNRAEQRKILVCFGCGRQFREGTSWETQVCRRIGEPIPRYPWLFEDDIWDLRELYPSVEEHRFTHLFLDFSNCGLHWFKELVKSYLLQRIHSGSGYRSLPLYVRAIGCFGRFLQKQGVTSMKGVNLQLLAIYWTQELGHYSKSNLHHEMGEVKAFFDWGNAEKRFQTPPNLITVFSRPKFFYKETDPLEEHVLEAIRDNLCVLPEPLQLMFVLGFWLGTRPGELCFMPKDCLQLDPNGSIWWVKFERQKTNDAHRLPITTDLVRLIQQQQVHITKIHGEDYPHLFCHYQGFLKSDYPAYPKLKALRRPPIIGADSNPMVKAIRHLIERCNICDSNGQLAGFTGAILRPSRATQFIRDGYSLEFIRIWLKHLSVNTTKRHYTRYRPGELLDVACVMANLDGKFIPYDSNPESLRQNPEQHELDGLKMPSGEPLHGYCMFREFCPRFGRCYTCGFHIATADKLPYYKAQLERLRIKKTEVFNYGSSELLESYTDIVNALEGKVAALEAVL